MFNFKRFFLFAIFLFSSYVNAAGDFYIMSGTGLRFLTPEVGCNFSLQNTKKDNPDAYIQSLVKISDSTPTYHCTVRLNKTGYATSLSIFTLDSCPSDTEFNSEKGECVAPEPDVPEIESFEFLFCYNYSGGDECESGTKQEVPREICKNGYVYEPSYSSEYTSCYGITSSSPAIYCSSVADLTSKTCSSEYQKQPADNSCPEGKKPGQLNGKFYCAGGEDVNGGEVGGGETGGGEGEGGSDGGETGGGESEGGSSGSGGGDGSGSGSGGGGSGGETGGGEGEGGSSGGGSGGGGSGGGGSSGSGSGEGAGEGAGQGESVAGCENCSFESDDPFGGDVPTFSESLTRANNAMKNSAIAQSLNNIKFPSGGSCPVGNTVIETPLGSIPLSFTQHCELWEKISPVLSAVFLAFWALISVRVFLSA